MRFPSAITTIVLALILVGCEEKTYVPMAKEHNRSGNAITITVYEYTSYNDVTRALDKFHRENKLPRRTDPSLGWAAWDREPPYQCEIHIKPPDKINDDDTMTLGHEMSHCLYGSYHR